MAEGKKLDLEELRKSFPSLDENSVSKLLGGGGHNPDGWTPPPFGSDTYDMGELSSVVIYHNGSGSGSSSGGSQGGPGGPHGPSPSVSGSDYFGDWDSGDDYEDFGWGEGWGDYDGGTDSNPGGSVGGNGQDSSGNPGNTDWLDWLRSSLWSNFDDSIVDTGFTVRNNTNFIIYYKPENGGGAIPIAPGEQISEPIDGLRIGGKVYKFVDEYHSIDVYNDIYITNYTDSIRILEQGVAGGRQWVIPFPGSEAWEDLWNVE